MLGLPKLESKSVVSHLAWVLGTEPWSCIKAASALDHWAISAAPGTLMFPSISMIMQSARASGVAFPASASCHINSWKKKRCHKRWRKSLCIERTFPQFKQNAFQMAGNAASTSCLRTETRVQRAPFPVAPPPTHQGRAGPTLHTVLHSEPHSGS